jgi:diacylglycerol O-acyltransferase
MSYTFFEPLSAVDASFLAVEDAHAHMHIGGVTIFDAGPLTRPEGGLDIERIREWVGSRLHRMPRFRQKLAWVPVSGAPVWVDDARFNIVYHVRHSALPFPGNEQKLKDLAGRIMSQHLDREKPLWELWFVEGLEGGRFALISKIHHAAADGISGVDMMSALVGPSAKARIERAPAWLPRPAPSGVEMFSSALRHTLASPLRLFEAEEGPSPAPLPDAAPEAARLPRTARAGGDLRGNLTKAFGALAAAVDSTDPTPLNVDIGPYRRFDWTKVDIDTIRAIRAGLGGKMNDVVLSVTSGAVRRFLQRRGVNVDSLDFRAMVPVSVRRERERGSLGNRITQLLTKLPVDEGDAVRRLAQTIDITERLKNSGLAEGGQAFTAFAELLGAPLMAMLARSASRGSFGNMVITNVPGPPVQTYLLGAPTLEAYPLVPLAPTQALNVAVLSYNGVLHWGINADWDAVPDIADFRSLLDEEMGRLVEAVRPTPIAVETPEPRSAAARSSAATASTKKPSVAKAQARKAPARKAPARKAAKKS